MRVVVRRGGRVINGCDLRVGRTVVGRDEGVDLLLPDDPFVSRQHCVLRFNGRKISVTDNGSANGTLLDGARVPAGATVGALVTSLVTIGPFTIEFSSQAPGRSAEPTHHVEEAFETLVSGSVGGALSWIAVVEFTAGPRRSERVPLLTESVTIGGPDAVLPLGLPRDAAVAQVQLGRMSIEPCPGARIQLDGVTLRRGSPVNPGDLLTIGQHQLRVRRERLWTPTPAVDAIPSMVGGTPVIRQLFGAILRYARHDDPVVILGPTGALARTLGAFREADGGTLFLDEFGELPYGLQPKLLRALDPGEVRRVGSSEVDHPNVRLVVATNRNLEEEVGQGRFRQELWERVAVVILNVPPLAARRDDLPLLAEALLAQHHPEARLTDGAVAKILRHDWPGNVRELRNALVRAAVAADDGVIEDQHIVFRSDLCPATDPPPEPATVVERAPVKDLEDMSDEELFRELAMSSERETADRRNISRGKVRYWLRKATERSSREQGSSRRTRSVPPR